MSTPWPPPSVMPGRPTPPTRVSHRWEAWLAVAVVVAGLALSVPAIGNLMTWASGELGGDRSLELNAGDLVNQGGGLYAAALVSTYVGLLAAALFALVAAPASRRGRWVVGAVLVALAAALVVGTALTTEEPPPTSLVEPSRGEVVLTSLLVAVPPLVLLLPFLVRGARRGAAGTALVLGAVAALAQLVTAVRLVISPADVGPGTWLVLLAALVGLAGTVLLVRAVRSA